jgi:hypothetical protein
MRCLDGWRDGHELISIIFFATQCLWCRYKICRVHSSSPLLVMDGEPMRFCQQCGRFHSLAAFDGKYRRCMHVLPQTSTHNALSQSPFMIGVQSYNAHTPVGSIQ